MTQLRTTEDKLREKYFALLPNLYKLRELLETKIRYALKEVMKELQEHERIKISSRIKECESAIASLKRRQEADSFDDTKEYCLSDLKDLVGVRVSYFPNNLYPKIAHSLSREFSDWSQNHTSDYDTPSKIIAHKYQGVIDKHTSDIIAEYQIVPLMIGLFWEVEHFAFYKPHQNYKGIINRTEMEECTQAIYKQFEVFEKTFAKIIHQSQSDSTLENKL